MRKILLSILSVLMLMSGCTAKQEVKEEPMTEVQLAFEQFLTDEYIDTVSSDALTLHFSLVDPSVYGIEQPELTLGEISDEANEEAEEELREVMEELEAFNPEELTERQRDDWNMLHEYLEIQMMFDGLSYYQNLFSPAQSVTDALITNFNEFKFYDEQDVKDYLVLLQDVPRYLGECLAFTRKQADMGLFMQDFSVDSTVSEINKFLNKEGDNALIVSFENKLQNADFETAEYFSENRRIVNELIIPAYQHVKDELETLKGKPQLETLSDTSESKAYYEALFAYKTGSSLTPSEMLEKGKSVLVSIVQDYIRLIYEDATISKRYEKVDYGNEDPEVILKRYQEKLLKHFPKGPEVTYTAEYLDPSITNDSTIAYYLIPPYDAIEDNVIKINSTATEGDSVTLYTTLAHEGFPGHLYQTTYYYATNPHPIRTLVDNFGYVEGYAMYVQAYANQWALEDDKNLAEFLTLDTEMNYLLQALVDIGVNYEGWGKEGIASFLRDLGFNDSPGLVNSLYEYVVSDPGLLLPYGIGLVEMKELRNYAEQNSKKFNEIEYHQIILESGPMYFDLLKEKVDNWLKK